MSRSQPSSVGQSFSEYSLQGFVTPPHGSQTQLGAFAWLGDRQSSGVVRKRQPSTQLCPVQTQGGGNAAQASAVLALAQRERHSFVSQEQPTASQELGMNALSHGEPQRAPLVEQPAVRGQSSSASNLHVRQLPPPQVSASLPHGR